MQESSVVDPDPKLWPDPEKNISDPDSSRSERNLK